MLIHKISLTKLLGLKNIPTPGTVGDWLRTMGISGVNATSLINRELCRIALKETKGITLDIDASEIISNKKEAKKNIQIQHRLYANGWSYSRNKSCN